MENISVLEKRIASLEEKIASTKDISSETETLRTESWSLQNRNAVLKKNNEELEMKRNELMKNIETLELREKNVQALAEKSKSELHRLDVRLSEVGNEKILLQKKNMELTRKEEKLAQGMKVLLEQSENIEKQREAMGRRGKILDDKVKEIEWNSIELFGKEQGHIKKSKLLDSKIALVDKNTAEITGLRDELKTQQLEFKIEKERFAKEIIEFNASRKSLSSLIGKIEEKEKNVSDRERATNARQQELEMGESKLEQRLRIYREKLPLET